MGCQLLTRTFPCWNCRGLSCSGPLATPNKNKLHVLNKDFENLFPVRYGITVTGKIVLESVWKYFLQGRYAKQVVLQTQPICLYEQREGFRRRIRIAFAPYRGQNPQNREKRVPESKNSRFPPPQKRVLWVKNPHFYTEQALHGKWGFFTRSSLVRGGRKWVFLTPEPSFPDLGVWALVRGNAFLKEGFSFFARSSAPCIPPRHWQKIAKLIPKILKHLSRQKIVNNTCKAILVDVPHKSHDEHHQCILGWCIFCSSLRFWEFVHHPHKNTVPMENVTYR